MTALDKSRSGTSVNAKPRRWRSLVTLVVAVAIAEGLVGSSASASLVETHEIREYSMPANVVPQSMTVGPDGAIWFTENFGHAIGRMTTAGVVTNQFPVPNGDGYTEGITTGPDGALWFTENFPDKIVRMTTDGAMSAYAVSAASGPAVIVSGPDGNLWFTETQGNAIGRMTTTGHLDEFPIVTPNSFPIDIVVGPDRALWFNEAAKVGRITTDGVITNEFTLPDQLDPGGVSVGPDGNLWISAVGGFVARMTTTGTVKLFSLPTGLFSSGGFTPGPDGKLWFIDNYANKIGWMTVSGQADVFPIPTAKAEAADPILGPDGGMWFTEAAAGEIGKIGRIAVAATPIITAPSSPVTLTTALGVAWSEVHPAWIANYDLRRAVAPWNGVLGAYTAWLTGRGATTVMATGTAGHTYCFQVRAHDIYGDTSGWSTRACSAIPLTATQIAYSSGWTKSTSSAYFGGVAMYTKTHGATATRTGISAKRLYLIATECPTCGTITFRWNGTALKTINLYRAATAHRQVLSIVTWTSPHTGTLTATVTSATGKTVILEGVSVSGV
jgi:virginiamycin B lyase